MFSSWFDHGRSETRYGIVSMNVVLQHLSATDWFEYQLNLCLNLCLNLSLRFDASIVCLYWCWFRVWVCALRQMSAIWVWGWVCNKGSAPKRGLLGLMAIRRQSTKRIAPSQSPSQLVCWNTKLRKIPRCISVIVWHAKRSKHLFHLALGSSATLKGWAIIFLCRWIDLQNTSGVGFLSEIDRGPINSCRTANLWIADHVNVARSIDIVIGNSRNCVRFARIETRWSLGKSD